jgi:peptidyl-prolyl cis-trans isomerase SurA
MKIKTLINILLLFILININNFLFASIQNRIIVKIENSIISTYELKNKINTFLILSNKDINQKNIDELKSFSLNYLIDLKIKEIELSKYNFQVDDSEVNNHLNNISLNNIDNLKSKFAENNLNFELYLEETKNEIKWRRLIYSFYKKKVNINDKEIEEELNNILTNQSNITEYNISEIELLLNNNANSVDIIDNIKKKIENLGFVSVAKQFSISTSSISGGELGWISEKALSKKTLDIIKKLKINEVSKPIKNPGSVLFLKLNNKRTSEIKNLDKDKLKNNLINTKKNELFNLYSNSHLSIIKNNTLIEFK